MAKNFMEAAKAAANKAPATKSKSSVPVITDAPAEVTAAITAYVKAKDQITQLEGEMKNQFSVVDEFATARQDANALKGNFSKSYKIQTDTGETVLYSSQNRFKINTEAEEDIKALLGDSFDGLVQEKLTVTVKEEVFENEDLMKELGELLGDNFQKFFNSKMELKVKDGYDEKIYGIAKTQKKLNEVRTFIEPWKHTLK
jgi:hypothetical protein